MVKKNGFFGKAMPYLVGFVFVLSTLIKLFYITGDNFAFTPDQGRDLIDIRRMVVSHIPRLVGPTTSINGVLLGPFYYYFISIPFILFGGNPYAIVVWQIVWFQLAALFIWYVLKKKNLVLGNITGILLLLSPIGFYTARYFWNANVMPIFTIIFFACLLDTLWHKNDLRLIILGLVAGVSLQIEAAFGLLFFPFAFLVLLIKKFSVKDLSRYTLAFFVTLLPQIFFEFRHGFMMTRTLIAGLSGTSADLGEKLPFMERLFERRDVFLTAMRQSNHISFEILGPILVLAILLGIFYLVQRKKARPGNDLIFISLGFMIFAAGFYMFFPQHLKNWYVFGLSIPFVILLSGVLTNLYHHSRLGSIFLWLVIFYSLFHTLLAHVPYLYENVLIPSSDPSNMATELRAVDWVYQEAGGKPFKVYSYLPSIYDFTYQYLFWWYGTKKYGYQPADIAYLPNVPEYIQDSDSFWTKKKLFEKDSSTFLIIQGDGDHQDRVFAWGGHFTSLCEIKSFAISSGLSVKKLGPCP